MLFALLSRAVLELLCFLVGLVDGLAHLALLLARLDRHGHAACGIVALFGGVADCAFGFFPVGGSGADFVSSGDVG